MIKVTAFILTFLCILPFGIGILESIKETITGTNRKNREYAKKRKHELEIEELNKQIKEEFEKRNQ